MTEILLFSGLFLAYAVFRALHPEVFEQASKMLNLKLGATNTVVLICSSLTMALAVRAGQTGNRPQQIIQLALTLAFASMFMVIKYIEYSAKIHHGILPGWYFNPHGAEAWIGQVPYARTFFSIYFMATGLHGFHVLCGMIVIAWLLMRLGARRLLSRLLLPDRGRRPLLAHRRHDLDFPLPGALPGG